MKQDLKCRPEICNSVILVSLITIIVFIIDQLDLCIYCICNIILFAFVILISFNISLIHLYSLYEFVFITLTCILLL